MRNRATREFILLCLVSFDLLIYLVRQLEPVPCISTIENSLSNR